MIEKQMTSGGEETKKLYYEDSHRKEFKATVLSCEERLTAKGKKVGYAVVLDQTAFFPNTDALEKHFYIFSEYS